MQIRKKKIKLFACDMVVCVESLKKMYKKVYSTKKRVYTDCKVQCQNSKILYIINLKYAIIKNSAIYDTITS